MSWKVFDDVCAAGVVLSVAVTVKVEVASKAVGVPLTCPFVVLKDKPAGSAELTAKFTVPNPPDAVTGVNEVIRVPAVTVAEDTACAVFSAGGLTVSWKVFDEICAASSVTVTTIVVAGNNPVGVPLTWPVVLSKVRPAGSPPENV